MSCVQIFCLFLLQEHVTFAVESKGHGTRIHFKEPENIEKLTLHIVYKFKTQKRIREKVRQTLHGIFFSKLFGKRKRILLDKTEALEWS